MEIQCLPGRNNSLAGRFTLPTPSPAALAAYQVESDQPYQTDSETESDAHSEPAPEPVPESESDPSEEWDPSEKLAVWLCL